MRLALVTACSKRKLIAPEADLLFRNLPNGDCATIADEWVKRARASDRKTRVSELYKGQSWLCAVRSVSAARQYCDADLIVASAGFGLVTENDKLPAYSATFAADLDRVAAKLPGDAHISTKHSDWWAAINSARSTTASPLSKLASYDMVVACLGANYLSALSADLTLLAEKLDPDKLMLIGVGAQSANIRPLCEYFLTIPVGFDQVATGPKNSINQRALNWLIHTCAGDLSRTAFSNMLGKITFAETTDISHRHRRTDEQVIEWIAARLRDRPSSRPTQLLRQYRNAGFACEQSRFHSLLKSAGIQP